MQVVERAAFSFRRSALKYAALVVIPAAIGLEAAHQDLDGNDFATLLLIFAAPIVLPQMIGSLVLSALWFLRKSLAVAVWHFVIAFVGLAWAVGPSIVVEYTPLFRPY